MPRHLDSSPPHLVCPEDFSLDWANLLPPPMGIFWRHRWKEYTDRYGLPFTRGYMQNLDSRGEGPSYVVQFGRVAYTREALVNWLNSHQGSSTKKRHALKKRTRDCGSCAVPPETAAARW